MKTELSQGALSLLNYLVKNQEVFTDYFNASNVCHRKGHIKVSCVQPLLEELCTLKALKLSKKLFRTPRYTLNLKKAEKLLETSQATEETIYTQEYRDALEEEIKKYKKFVVTTAVMGKDINKPFVESVRNYAKRHNALLLVLPCEDVSSRGRKAAPIELSPELSDFRVIFKDTYLNKNLCLSAIKVSAKQINPLTGLDRMAVNRQASIIVASPKVFLKYIPNMHYDIPPAIMTTGAITVNNYDNDRYMSKRTSVLAENDHSYGVVIVEVENENIFHFRHVQASSENTLTDMGTEYLSNGKIRKLDESVMVVGDSHIGYHDPDLHTSVMQLARETSTSIMVLHDIFNGTSITHHDVGKALTKAKKAEEGTLSLETECMAVQRYLEAIEYQDMDIVIPSANHHDHLTRYLEEGRYVTDPMNHKFSLKIAAAAIDGHDPLRYAIENVLSYKSDRIHWLGVDQSCKFYGVECGIHGHKGSGGRPGSLATFEKGVGNCVTAHTHSAAILRNSFCVGTVGLMNMGYNEGLSNWTRTCCLIYENGTKQLINFIPSKEGFYSYHC